MAGVALCGSCDVLSRFSLGILRDETAAVAGNTFSGCAGVVHGGRWPGNKAADMASIALVGGRNVRCGFGIGVCKIK